MAQHDCHCLLRFRIRYQKLSTVHEKHAAARVLAAERPRDFAEDLPSGRHEIEGAVLAHTVAGVGRPPFFETKQVRPLMFKVLAPAGPGSIVTLTRT